MGYIGIINLIPSSILLINKQIHDKFFFNYKKFVFVLFLLEMIISCGFPFSIYRI